MDYEKKIESLKTQILTVENDLLKLRAKKTALERERDAQTFYDFKEAQKNDKRKSSRAGGDIRRRR